MVGFILKNNRCVVITKLLFNAIMVHFEGIWKKDVIPILWERLWGVANKNTHNDILQFIKFRWICLSFLNCYCIKTRYKPPKIRIWGGISYIIFKRPFEFKLASTAAQVTDQISVAYIVFRLSLYRIQLPSKVYQIVFRLKCIYNQQIQNMKV